MFNQLVAIEPVHLTDAGIKELQNYAEEVILFEDIPANDEEIVDRIGDADAVLVCYTSRITGETLAKCPNVKYVGMCCSLYSEASANVDIAYAREHGIDVRGIRDYGDRGVVEFVLCELVRFLHGYDRPMWKDQPQEITRLKTGIIGLGVSGTMVGEALQFMGAEVSYYSRTRKPEKEEAGFVYRELHDLLAHCDVIFTCLNKNVILLGEKEFEQMGNGKILFNTSIGPSHEVEPLKKWLAAGDNWFVCDTAGAIGDTSLVGAEHIVCEQASAGCTEQAYELLTEKVLANIRAFLQQE